MSKTSGPPRRAKAAPAGRAVSPQKKTAAKPKKSATAATAAGSAVRKKSIVPLKAAVKRAAAPARLRRSPPTVTPVVRPVRRNKRSDVTIANILEATEEVILSTGADRISILEVCDRAGVSRGTFYRYFSSQDELLDAFSLHKRQGFHQALLTVTEPHATPESRLNALIDYLEDYLDVGRARRLLLVAPEYALGFFKRVFHDSALRFQDVLGIVFDAWDKKLGMALDRELVCELLIRYVMSELMVPGGAERRDLPERVGRMVAAIAAMPAPRARRRA